MGKLAKRLKTKKTRGRIVSKSEQYKKELAKKIRGLKGKHFTGMFSCDLCKVTHTNGYLYTLNDVEYEICKFCNDKIHHKQNYIRILSTPMGNKR